MERWPYNYQVKEATGTRDPYGDGDFPGWWLFYPPRGRKDVSWANFEGPYATKSDAVDDAERTIYQYELDLSVEDDDN